MKSGCSHPRVRGRRLLTALTAVALAAGTAISPAAPATAAAKVVTADDPYTESFRGIGTRPNEWYTGTGTRAAQVEAAKDSWPCLTAARTRPAGGIPQCASGKPVGIASGQVGNDLRDAVGQGALQLTGNRYAGRSTGLTSGESGYTIRQQPFDRENQGVHFEFDMYQWGGRAYSGKTGDGISFFLSDGDVDTNEAGQPGASLGYQGLKGAIVGVGFDVFGNFSTTRAGKGGPGVRANHVALRGSENSGYAFIAGSEADGPLAVQQPATRDAARRRVFIDLTGDDKKLTVRVNYNPSDPAAKPVTELDRVSIGDQALPRTLRYGFAASTGAASDVHQIQNLVVNTIRPVKDPNLNIKTSATGGMVAGQPAEIRVDVANNAQAGPTRGTVTVNFVVEAGARPTAARGTGWTCEVGRVEGKPNKWGFTCTRPGSGGDALQPGKAYPPIRVAINTCGRASCAVCVKAKVDTPGETDPKDNVTKQCHHLMHQTSLGVTISSSPNPRHHGVLLTYTVTVTNGGPSDAPTAFLSTKLPNGAGRGEWSCKATRGSMCPGSLGTRDLADEVYVAKDGEVTFTTKRTVPLTGTLTATANIRPPAAYRDDNCEARMCSATDRN